MFDSPIDVSVFCKLIENTVYRIHRELTDMEKEYREKGIFENVRLDRRYCYYEGKFMAYLFVLQKFKYPINVSKKCEERIRYYTSKKSYGNSK